MPNPETKVIILVIVGILGGFVIGVGLGWTCREPQAKQPQQSPIVLATYPLFAGSGNSIYYREGVVLQFHQDGTVTWRLDSK